MLEFFLHSRPGWYSFSSWPHSDTTSLDRLVTCTFLHSTFFTAEMFWDRISVPFKSIHVGFPATQNTCDRYNKFVTDHLKNYTLHKR